MEYLTISAFPPLKALTAELFETPGTEAKREIAEDILGNLREIYAVFGSHGKIGWYAQDLDDVFAVATSVVDSADDTLDEVMSGLVPAVDQAGEIPEETVDTQRLMDRPPPPLEFVGLPLWVPLNPGPLFQGIL